MKRITGIVFSLLLTSALVLSVSCQREDTAGQNDLAAANLKGEIFKIEKNLSWSSERGPCCPAGEKNYCSTELYIYNKKGFLEKSCTVDGTGDTTSVARYYYKDGFCNLIRKSEAGTPSGTEENIIRKGLLAETTLYDSEGKLIEKNSYSYQDGEVTSGTTTDNSGRIAGSFTNVIENGKLMIQTFMNESGAITRTSRNTWNDNNDLAVSEVSLPLQNSGYRLVYDYEYDEKGNWTKQTQTVDGEIVGIIQRKISYFDL